MAEEFKAFEAAGWNARAATYDALTARATAFAIEPLLDAAGVGPGTHLLDVGCGPGALVAAALARGAEVVGADLAEQMVITARNRNGDASFFVADAEALPFLDGAFDVAVGAFLVNHTPDAPAAVAELRRVARTVVLAAWGPAEEVAFLDLPSRALEGLGGVPDGPDSERYAHPDRLAALLGDGTTVTTVRETLHVDSLDALWDGVRGGTVRTAARIEAASEAERARVRERLTTLAQPYAVATGYALPVTILIACCPRRAA